MPSQLSWSNRAHTGMLPHDGKFANGDARWCGYIDLAMHIARQPKHFTLVDRRKARKILLGIGAVNLASQIPLEEDRR